MSTPEKPISSTAPTPTSSPMASGGLLPEQNPVQPPSSQEPPLQTRDDPVPDYDSLYDASSPGSIIHEKREQPNAQHPSTSSAPGSAPPIPSATAADSSSKKSWGGRISSLTSRLGAPGFMPGPMDKECEKAAAILRSFSKTGVYTEPSTQSPKPRTIITIPPRVIANAVGLAIFTTLRAGFHVSGAAGSGVIVARLPDGSWSAPSGIQILSVGTGFQFGIDMYDCVCVINTREALAAFMEKTRVSLGSDMAISAGPYGAGGAVEVGAPMDRRAFEDRKKKAKETREQPLPDASNQKASLVPPTPSRRSSASSTFKPVFSYVKSRGFYAGIQIDGTVIVERSEANAAFYGQSIPASQILARRVDGEGQWLAGVRVLLDALKAAETAAPPAVSEPAAVTRDVPVEGMRGGGELPPPGYEPGVGREELLQGETRADDSVPPAYADDGVARPEIGDHKMQS
ncbi:hypothetical protein S40288_02352 [Stachybotrys chartarum IBT 40288]|nr:hypothetical protein S40288_02352 [Stachybotrys chartarum IBT 40288]